MRKAIHGLAIKQFKRHEYFIYNECKYFFNSFFLIYKLLADSLYIVCNGILFHIVLLEYDTIFNNYCQYVKTKLNASKCDGELTIISHDKIISWWQ